MLGLLSHDMTVRTRSGREFLVVTSRELDRQRQEQRRPLERIGLGGEQCFQDFLLILRDARRYERAKAKAALMNKGIKTAAYSDTFEDEPPTSSEEMNSASDRVSESAPNRDQITSPLETFGDFAKTIACLQTVRRVSTETASAWSVSLNAPNNPHKSLKDYLTWCISSDHSVLDTMMLFDIYATENTLSDVSQRLRFDHFQSFRNLLLGRLVDGKYLRWSDYVDAVVNQDKTLTDLSSDLETKVSNRNALDTFIRDLHIISLRSDGLTLQGIADELDLTRERIRQRLAIYSSQWNFVLNPGAGRRFASKEDSLQFSEDEKAKEILVTNIVRRVRAHPGISIEELAAQLDVAIDRCAKSIPRELKKFMASQFDHDSAKQWTDQRILDTLNVAATYSYPLSVQQYESLRREGAFDGPSAVLIDRRFGNWSSACEAAGIASGSRPKREYDRTWSEEDLWKIVFRYFLDPKTSGSLSDFNSWLRDSKSAYSSGANFRLRLGSWTVIRTGIFGRLLSGDHAEAFQSYCDQISITREGVDEEHAKESRIRAIASRF